MAREDSGATSVENAPGETERLEWTIADALIAIAYQPVVDLQQGQIAGFEALARPHASTGFLNAGALFDSAERAGMLWPLEELTRAAACENVGGWAPGTLLFLNCSPQVVVDPRFAAAMVDLVSRAGGLSPGSIVLEITERTDQQDIEGLAEQVAVLKSHGFQIALDDVGAGSSGLNRLLSLRPNWLKLDRALVEAIDQDRVRQNLVRFLVHFSKLSGVRVIAEGIERREELETLIGLGVPFGQGYYLGRPGSHDRTLESGVASWLRERCAAMLASQPEEPGRERVERFAAPARTAESWVCVSDLLGHLLRDPRLPGIAVVENDRYVGWFSRERLIDAARNGQGGRPCGSVVPRSPGPIEPGATMAEALGLVAARDEHAFADPLVIAHGGRVRGVVSVRDLIGAAADMVQHLHSRTTPVTGLPGRVLADEHLTLQTRAAAETEPADAAIVDIRQFTDYNGAYGYELGDKLLQDVKELLRSQIVRADPHVFLAHLGDDRFLLTAPPGVLAERVMTLVDRFELTAVGADPRPSAATSDPAIEVGLRIVLLPGVFGRIEEPRDLFRLYARVRHETSPSASCATYPVGRGSIIIEERPPSARLQRMVA